MAFVFSFLRKAKKEWERGGWINAVRGNYLGRKDRNPVFLPGTPLVTQGKLQHNSKTAEVEAQRQGTKMFIKTQNWKELTSIIMPQKITLLNFLAQKNQEQLPLEKRWGKKIKDRGAKSHANSEEQGVVAEMHKSCTFKCGEFGSFLKRKSNCYYKYWH